jgi:hypothetical protein
LALTDHVEDLTRVLIPRLHAFQVDHTEAAKLSHLDAKAHVRDSVHRAGDDRIFKVIALPVLARDVEARVDLQPD